MATTVLVRARRVVFRRRTLVTGPVASLLASRPFWVAATMVA